MTEDKRLSFTPVLVVNLRAVLRRDCGHKSLSFAVVRINPSDPQIRGPFVQLERHPMVQPVG